MKRKMAKKPEIESSKELTAAYLQNFTATYLDKLAVFNNFDLSALDTKAKGVEALSALPKIRETGKILSQEPSGEILKLVTTINQNHSEQMERLIQAIDNKSKEDESRFKIRGLSRLLSDDDVRCYLDTFERLAKLHKKDPFYWTCILEPLLTGKHNKQFIYCLIQTKEILLGLKMPFYWHILSHQSIIRLNLSRVKRSPRKHLKNLSIV